MARRYPTSVYGDATVNEQMFPCVINQSINFISNDSPTYDMMLNFDKTISESGGLIIKKGESISDIVGVSFSRINVMGLGGTVPFRIVGV